MEIKIPAVGESVTEATLGEWMKKNGDYVQRDEVLLVIETDKASVELVAEASGVLSIEVGEGETVKIGTVIGKLDTSVPGPVDKGIKTEPSSVEKSSTTSSGSDLQKSDKSVEPKILEHQIQYEDFSPAVRRILLEKGINPGGIDPGKIQGTGRGGRLTKEDVMKGGMTFSTPGPEKKPKTDEGASGSFSKIGKTGGGVERVKMTTIRKRIAERLVQAQQTAAILTTFNEVDMSALIDIRSRYKETFEKKHGVRLGFMGFFVKASLEALKEFPAVNASIEGTDILYKNFFNIGVAVSSPKGLVVPVIKNADQMNLAEIERTIRDYAVKSREGKITIDDMSNGTFTISNGGVFGSLMSTPILNPPQSGILGMHKIEKRPVVVGDEIKIRPMMYLAFSYDHRMIDGKESVGFLVKIKESIEAPSRLLLHV